MIMTTFMHIIGYLCLPLPCDECVGYRPYISLWRNYFFLSSVGYLSHSYDLVKMLPVRLCMCLDINQSRTDRNSCIQRLVKTWSHNKKTRSHWPTLLGFNVVIEKNSSALSLQVTDLYAHQSCTAGASDVNAPTDRLNKATAFTM